MICDIKAPLIKKVAPFIGLFCILLACSSMAQAGVISITSLEYPGPPETLSIGEKVPIAVNVKYSNIEDSTFTVHFAYKDFPPRFQMGKEIRLSGSGTYQFPPTEIMVPADYSIPSGWPLFVNEWHLTAQIWKADRLRAGKDFTLLVENPEHKPDLEISKIDYVVPPDTIAIGELSRVNVHIKYSNMDEKTKAEAIIQDQTGIIASKLSRKIPGSGEYIFTIDIRPTMSGPWNLEVSVSATSGQLLVIDKKSFMIQVV